MRFWGTWSGVSLPEIVPSCRELNSDDFPFFRNLSSSSGTKDSFFGSCYKKSSSSSSRLIKRNENCWQPPAQGPVVDKEEKAIEIFSSSQLAKLSSSQLANYWTVGKCLVSVCFSPFSAIFFAFTPFSCTYKTNFEKKISPDLDFLSAVEAQTFCRNSGRVATAYSTDKYKKQNMKIRVSWVGQSTT